MKLQETIFQDTIKVSESLEKPLILHAVRTHDRILYFHKQYKPKQPWIFHGFNKNLKQALRCVEAGCYLSFGEDLLKNEAMFTEILNKIPLNRIFFENDNSKIKIQEIYKVGSRILDLDIEELKTLTINNFNDVFKKTPIAMD
jgi:TatD DNase family protein